MAGIGNAVKSGLAGIAGNIAHATITFPATNPGSTQPQRTEVAAQASGLARVSSALKQTAQGLGSVLGGSVPSITQNVFQVQFNPNSLRLSASGGGRVPITNYLAGGGTITYGSMDPNITLSVTLLFDAVNNQDAFFQDKFSLSTTSLAKGIATGAQILKGKSYSVQPQVEGFIGALRWPERRKNVKFAWGTLCYEGYLNNVSSTYTMFSSTGNPIRAEVTLNLLVTGTEEAMNAWYNKYVTVLNQAASKGTGAITNTGLSNQMTNLLNL